MNLNEIIFNVKEAQKKYLSFGDEPSKIVTEIKHYILKNIDLLEDAYNLDKGINLSKSKIEQQFKIEQQNSSQAFLNQFGKITNLYVPFGVLGVISNCDVYHILKLIVLALLTRNGLVINIIDNVGTNYLIIKNVKKVLSEYGIENLIEIYNNNAGETLEDCEDIDGIIYIGKKVNSDRLKISNTKPIIYSGCGNYELYIEDVLDEKVIRKVIQDNRIKVYTKVPNLGQEVRNLEEAVARIMETGNEYSVGIITENRENAKMFVNKIKARNVFVNTLPTQINDELDIEPKDLVYRKSVFVS